MTQGDVITFVQDIIGEPDYTGRFSDSDLQRKLFIALDQLALAIEWPEAYADSQTSPNVQEYQLPGDVLSLLRVYVNGQPLVPTTIPIMEGTKDEVFDQGDPNTMQPQWRTLAPTTYPIFMGANSGPVPMLVGIPYRPSYYPRGGYLGLVPAPVGTYPIHIEYIPVPPKPSSDTSTLVFPDFMKLALAEKMLELCKKADHRYDEANEHKSNFETQCAKLQAWKRKFIRSLPTRPRPQTYRQFYGGHFARRRMFD